MPAKLERCVRKVSAKNKGRKKKVNPWAVCSNATGYVRKRGGGWTKKRKKKRKRKIS